MTWRYPWPRPRLARTLKGAGGKLLVSLVGLGLGAVGVGGVQEGCWDVSTS